METPVSLLWGGICFHCCANEGIQQWGTIQLLRYRGILICHNTYSDILLYYFIVTYMASYVRQNSYKHCLISIPIWSDSHKLYVDWGFRTTRISLLHQIIYTVLASIGLYVTPVSYSGGPVFKSGPGRPDIVADVYNIFLSLSRQMLDIT
jgi:hypothetical protein